MTIPTPTETPSQSVRSATQGTGTAAINADNARIDYTPAANFNGTDTITYTVSDGTATDTGTLTITVAAANDAPTVVNDTESTDDNTALSGILLLDDDSDVDGDTLTLTGITSPTNGSVALVGNTVTYTPTPNTGTYTETLTYTVSDGTTSSTGTLTITVNASNDAPVAVDDTETLTEDDSLTTITVLDDDTDADGDSLTVSAISYSGTGTAAINADNARIDYTPAANFNGTDTITYTVSDGTATDTGTLTIIVNAVNDAPVAVDDTETVTEGDPLSSFVVLDDDTDADSDTLSVSNIAYSGTGAVAVNADNARIDYTPSTDFSGTDTITYTVSDGTATDTGTLTITVTAVNDAPVATNDSEALTEDDSLTSITVLDDDTDADGDSLTVSAISYSGYRNRCHQRG